MKNIKLIIATFIIAFSSVGCSMQAVEEVSVTSEEIIVDSIEEMNDLYQWNSASYDFFTEYMEEPETFEQYEDYYHIICYMLLNHIEYYEVSVESPEYGEETVHEILTEMAAAYDEVTLLLNTYTDFWSCFTGGCTQKVDASGKVTTYTYCFEFSQKDGLANAAVELEVELAEEACFQQVESMFEEEILTAGMTEKERAYVIYEWICTNVEYAYDAPDTDSDEIKPDNCFSAMIDKCAVCQGITGAYVQLCRLAGVEMYVQLGYTNNGTHSWCKLIDEETGEWMYIDPTWGITGATGEEEYTNEWFWVTQEYMEMYESEPRVFTTYLE